MRYSISKISLLIFALLTIVMLFNSSAKAHDSYTGDPTTGYLDVHCTAVGGCSYGDLSNADAGNWSGNPLIRKADGELYFTLNGTLTPSRSSYPRGTQLSFYFTFKSPAKLTETWVRFLSRIRVVTSTDSRWFDKLTCIWGNTRYSYCLDHRHGIYFGGSIKGDLDKVPITLKTIDSNGDYIYQGTLDTEIPSHVQSDNKIQLQLVALFGGEPGGRQWSNWYSDVLTVRAGDDLPDIVSLRVTSACSADNKPANTVRITTNIGDNSSRPKYLIYRDGTLIREARLDPSLATDPITGERYYNDTSVTEGQTYTYKVIIRQFLFNPLTETTDPYDVISNEYTVTTATCTVDPCAYTPVWNYGSAPTFAQVSSDTSQLSYLVVFSPATDGTNVATQFIIDWGDGNSSTVSATEATTTGVTHTWSTYGDYTVTYKVKNDCHTGPDSSYILPVHKFRLLLTTYRANIAGNVTQTGQVYSPTIATQGLTNGQSSLTESKIVDENGTHFTSGNTLSWDEQAIYYPPTTGELKPQGEVFDGNSADYAKYYYIPAWDGEDADNKQHLFRIITIASSITFGGLTINIIPLEGLTDYTVARPIMKADTTTISLTLYDDSYAEKSLDATNERNLAATFSNDEAMGFKWVVRKTINSPTGYDWVSIGTLAPQPLYPDITGPFTITIDARGVPAGGPYTAVIEIDTDPSYAVFPSTDAWGNGPISVGRNIPIAFGGPKRIIIELTVLKKPTSTAIPKVIGDVFSSGNAAGIKIDPLSVVSAGQTINVEDTTLTIPGYTRDIGWATVQQDLRTKVIDRLINERAIRITNSGQNYLIGSSFNLNPADDNPSSSDTNIANPAGGVWYVPGDLVFTAADTKFANRGTIIVGGSVRLPSGDKTISYLDANNDLIGIIALGQEQDLEFQNYITLVGAYYVPGKAIIFNHTLNTESTALGLFVADQIKVLNPNITIIYDGRITNRPPLGFSDLFLPSLAETTP